jgi:preprotein translocase subunit SecG
MNVASPRLVLLCTLVLSSPAILGALHGSMGIDTALKRVLIGLVVCWVAVALVTNVWRHNERNQRPQKYPYDPTEPGEESR